MSSPLFTIEYISDKLKQNLETTHLSVEDMSDGCGMKFNAVIVSDKFEGIPLLERHRMVNTILSDELKSIHAFTMKTITTKQYNDLLNKK
ncbi:bolA-like protein 2 [Oppia nitens]|uniref:bolA-like protein 2 n=1 Tax=Oppia nitens TaxID=1686743 RepID=UPI0023DAA2D2|nr:bolA-like protein 2 [Oppia nitens]